MIDSGGVLSYAVAAERLAVDARQLSERTLHRLELRAVTGRRLSDDTRTTLTTAADHLEEVAAALRHYAMPLPASDLMEETP